MANANIDLCHCVVFFSRVSDHSTVRPAAISLETRAFFICSPRSCLRVSNHGRFRVVAGRRASEGAGLRQMLDLPWSLQTAAPVGVSAQVLPGVPAGRPECLAERRTSSRWRYISVPHLQSAHGVAPQDRIRHGRVCPDFGADNVSMRMGGQRFREATGSYGCRVPPEGDAGQDREFGGGTCCNAI